MRHLLPLVALLALPGCSPPMLAAVATVAGIAADEMGILDHAIDAIQTARGKSCTKPEPSNAIQGL